MRALAAVPALSPFAFSAFAQSAFAQTYPAKPPRLYVGFIPGGGVDQTARISTAKLSEITAFAQAEHAKWAKVIREAGITPE